MIDELPKGWEAAAIADFARTATGGTPSRKREEYYGGDIPWVKSGDLNDGLVTSVNESITQLGLANSNAKMFPKGAVCIALYGATVGKLGILDIDAATNQAVCGIFPEDGIDSRYVFYALRNERANLIAQAQGGAQPNISNGIVKKTQLPIPPEAEQCRIVARIEALQERSRKARETLAEVGPLLEQFRQSLLAAAFRGELTADWRAAHPDVEPASELLNRIRQQRRQEWEQAELAKYEAKGKQPPKRWKEKYAEPDLVDDSVLPRLPDGWCWCRLGMLGADPLNTVQTGPFGAQLHRDDFVVSGVPVIAVGNLTGVGFTEKNLYFISDVKAEQLSRYEVQAGDVLFARSGATLGKVCVAPEFVRNWRMTGHILRARLNTEFVFPEFAVYALWGDPSVKNLVTRGIRGMTRPGYNTTLLNAIPLPLPPIPEQRQILGVIENALDRTDDLVSVQSESESYLNQLDQSILAKAFRGELVPQDPSDEPASVLLERIRQ